MTNGMVEIGGNEKAEIVCFGSNAAGAMDKSTNPQIHKSTNPQIHKSTNPQIHKSTNPQIHKSTNPQIHKSTNPQIHKSTNPQIHKSTNPTSTQQSNILIFCNNQTTLFTVTLYAAIKHHLNYHSQPPNSRMEAILLCPPTSHPEYCITQNSKRQPPPNQPATAIVLNRSTAQVCCCYVAGCPLLVPSIDIDTTNTRNANHHISSSQSHSPKVW